MFSAWTSAAYSLRNPQDDNVSEPRATNSQPDTAANDTLKRFEVPGPPHPEVVQQLQEQVAAEHSTVQVEDVEQRRLGQRPQRLNCESERRTRKTGHGY